jgi:hypothetical protein
MSGSQPVGKTPASASSAATNSPSTASLIGGVALVGAAAGYAMLAMRFRKIGIGGAAGADRFAAGSAEMRAGEAFSREWARSQSSANSFSANAGQAGARAGASSGSQTRSSRSSGHAHTGHAESVPGNHGPPQWALEELGMNQKPASYAEAKAMYRERAKRYHPDSGGESADVEAFKRLSRAWNEVKQHM